MSRKIIGITVGTQLPKPNFKQTDPTKGDYIKNKPDFAGLESKVEQIEETVDNIQKNAYDDTELRGIMSQHTTDIDALEELVGDKKVSDQIAASLTEANSYTDTSIEGISEGFSNVIYQMYGEDFPQQDDSAPTIRDIANDEANTALESAKSYADTKTSGMATTAVVDNKISSHNTSTSAHNDIRTSLSGKVDKVSGKGLSTNDYTTTEKNKLAGISDGANKTVVDSALSSTSTNPVQNKVVNTAISNLSTLVGDTKVSTQISNAIANKSDVGHKHDTDYDAKGAADTALASAKTYADNVKNDLLNGAGAAYDTLKELGDLINDNQDAIDALEAVAAGKADASALTSHTGNKSNPHGVTAAQVGAVPTSRTVNGKALSANITLSAGDVGADASGAANTALTNAKAYTDAEISEWIGDTTVAEQISTAIASKSDSSHTHDGRYYTESEIDTKLSGKADTGHNHDSAYAAKSHGNHVPATETANNAKFLRNDNTWQTVTPANIGAAASSHGTHVSYSTTAPVMDGTASVGSASTVARSDHKHPTDTSRAAASDLAALQALVGDEKVSAQINAAVATKSQVQIITWEADD